MSYSTGCPRRDWTASLTEARNITTKDIDMTEMYKGENAALAKIVGAYEKNNTGFEALEALREYVAEKIQESK